MEFETKQPMRREDEEQVKPQQLTQSGQKDSEKDEEDLVPHPTSIQRGIQRMPVGKTESSNQPVALTKSNFRKMAVNNGGAHNQPLAFTHPAVQVQQRLQGKGENLSGETKGKVEGALGENLSGVKIHTGSEANEIAQDHNARALTVGQDIAFANGEYKPGTPEGDALLLHELHHTLQQKGASENPEKQMKEEGPQANDHAYEKEADEAALAGTSRIWGGTKSWLGSMAGKTKNAMKSGLKLQTCSGGNISSGEYDKSTVDKLKKYLTDITAENKPKETEEGKENARAILEAWKKGYGWGIITMKQKELLVQELSKGTISSSDQGLIDDVTKTFPTPGKNTFSDEDIWQLVQEARENAELSQGKKDCITTVRKIVIPNLYKKIPKADRKTMEKYIKEECEVLIVVGKEKKMRNRMQDAMTGVVRAGYAKRLTDSAGNDVMFKLDSTGKPIEQKSPTAMKRMKDYIGGRTGWHAFGIAIFNSYHSVTLLVDYRGGEEYNVYWIDQNDYSTSDTGFDEKTGRMPGVRRFTAEGFDQHLLYATDTWWSDKFSHGVNWNTNSVLWALSPKK